MLYKRRSGILQLIVGFSRSNRRKSNCCPDGEHEVMKYLNVAEKNDAAKTIAGQLSNGTARRVSSLLDA